LRLFSVILHDSNGFLLLRVLRKEARRSFVVVTMTDKVANSLPPIIRLRSLVFSVVERDVLLLDFLPANLGAGVPQQLAEEALFAIVFLDAFIP
jgi:hypothetical protein